MDVSHTARATRSSSQAITAMSRARIAYWIYEHNQINSTEDAIRLLQRFDWHITVEHMQDRWALLWRDRPHSYFASEVEAEAALRSHVNRHDWTVCYYAEVWEVIDGDQPVYSAACLDAIESFVFGLAVGELLNDAAAE